MAGQVEKVEQQNHPKRLFWGSRGMETALVIVGLGLIVTATETDPYRAIAGVTIATVGIKGIIEGLRDLKKSRTDVNPSSL